MRSRIVRPLALAALLSAAFLLAGLLIAEPDLNLGRPSGAAVQAAAAPAVQPAAAAPSPVPNPHGAAGPAAPGTPVQAGRLPDQPEGDRPTQPRETPRRYPVDQGTFGRLKAQANQAGAANDRGAGPPPPPGPAPQFAAVSYTGWNPPDSGLAVGPAHVLVAINESFSIFTRTGSRLKGPTSLGGLFGTTDSTFDPRALYDPYTRAQGGQDHFVVLATAAGYLSLATSQTGDPTSTWCAYRLTVDPSGATWADYPSLGMDGDYLYVTTNQFANSDNSFQYAELQVVPKTSVYGSAGVSCPTAAPQVFSPIQNPGGGNAFTVQPATQPDARPGQSAPMYLVNAIWSSGSNLAVRTVTPAPNAPPSVANAQWVASGYIAPYDLPADAPQPRGTTVDTGDTRLLGAVYRYGKIYTANTTMHVSGIPGATPSPYANAQWYEITPNSLTNSVGASHAITSSSVAFFFPNILPGCSAATCTTPTVVLQVSGSGRSQPASAFVTRGGAPSSYASGVGGYTLNSRWGDYAGVAADPAATGPVWVLGEYAQSGGAWGTAVTSVSP